MYLIDSAIIYKNTCECYCLYRQSQWNNLQAHYSGYWMFLTNSNDIGGFLWMQYMTIIQIMFYELITNKESSLLSCLCSVNKINVTTDNYTIKHNNNHRWTGCDLYPLIVGLNTAITKNLDECYRIYSKEKYGEQIFQNKPFNRGWNYANMIAEELQKLDYNIGQILSSATQNGDKQKEKTTELKKVEARDTISRIPNPEVTDKLNKFAENRKANDLALSEQIEQLQLSLQNELQQIIAIREGIDYNITQEAISQFVFLFSLLNDTLQYHSGSNRKDGYSNLIESCEDLLENIMQSLTMLGVEMINDVGKPFDPGRHKAVSGMQPKRLSSVTKVVKIGFIYKNKVLEKAEVEIT